MRSPLLLLLLVSTAAALTCFWTAALTSKGGPTHRAFGRAFARLAYAAAGAGAMVVAAGAAGPDLSGPGAWTALYGLLLLVVPVQHGIAVIAAGPRPAAVRSQTHAALNVSAMMSTVFLLAAVVVWQYWIALLITPIGFVMGLRNIAYAARASATPRDWEVEHLTSLITGGAVLHTGLIIAGVRASAVPGGAVAWSVPTFVAVAAIAWLRVRHRRAWSRSGG